MGIRTRLQEYYSLYRWKIWQRTRVHFQSRLTLRPQQFPPDATAVGGTLHRLLPPPCPGAAMERPAAGRVEAGSAAVTASLDARCRGRQDPLDAGGAAGQASPRAHCRPCSTGAGAIRSERWGQTHRRRGFGSSSTPTAACSPPPLRAREARPGRRVLSFAATCSRSSPRPPRALLRHCVTGRRRLLGRWGWCFRIRLWRRVCVWVISKVVGGGLRPEWHLTPLDRCHT
jgi:hypothetical protein